MDRRIKSAVQTIEANFYKPLSVKGVAAQVGLGPSRLEHPAH